MTSDVVMMSFRCDDVVTVVMSRDDVIDGFISHVAKKFNRNPNGCHEIHLVR